MPQTMYRSGEAVCASGLYKVIHYQSHPAAAQPAEDMHRFVAGEIFPHCIVCADDVAYLLITGAPHLLKIPISHPFASKQAGFRIHEML